MGYVSSGNQSKNPRASPASDLAISEIFGFSGTQLGLRHKLISLFEEEMYDRKEKLVERLQELAR